MSSILTRLVEKAASVAPGQVGAALDELRPNLAHGFGGPFNGQERRLAAVREMFDRIPFQAVIETGTYRATTTLYLRDLTDAPIATIEVSPRYYHYSRRRLKGARDISLIRGESPAVLRRMATDPTWNVDPAFFYLDAHWLADLPLTAELTAIAHGWRDYAVMVDDFRVPDDPGYAYDDYGTGKVLELETLSMLADRTMSVFWPAAHSSSESGSRRGWIVLATPGSVTEALQGVAGLRPGGVLETLVGRANRSDGG